MPRAIEPRSCTRPQTTGAHPGQCRGERFESLRALPACRNLSILPFFLPLLLFFSSSSSSFSFFFLLFFPRCLRHWGRQHTAEPVLKSQAMVCVAACAAAQSARSRATRAIAVFNLTREAGKCAPQKKKKKEKEKKKKTCGWAWYHFLQTGELA